MYGEHVHLKRASFMPLYASHGPPCATKTRSCIGVGGSCSEAILVDSVQQLQGDPSQDNGPLDGSNCGRHGVGHEPCV